MQFRKYLQKTIFSLIGIKLRYLATIYLSTLSFSAFQKSPDLFLC